MKFIVAAVSALTLFAAASAVSATPAFDGNAEIHSLQPNNLGR